jgi:hypothetical protein
MNSLFRMSPQLNGEIDIQSSTGNKTYILGCNFYFKSENKIIKKSGQACCNYKEDQISKKLFANRTINQLLKTSGHRNSRVNPQCTQ